MRDPGLDKHQWVTAFEQLEPLLEDAPAEALPELGDLVEQMMVELNFPLDDEIADDSIEPALRIELRTAREITERVERGQTVDPGDLGEAIHAYRDIYEHLIGQPHT